VFVEGPTSFSRAVCPDPPVRDGRSTTVRSGINEVLLSPDLQVCLVRRLSRFLPCLGQNLTVPAPLFPAPLDWVLCPLTWVYVPFCLTTVDVQSGPRPSYGHVHHVCDSLSLGSFFYLGLNVELDVQGCFFLTECPIHTGSRDFSSSVFDGFKPLPYLFGSRFFL